MRDEVAAFVVLSTDPLGESAALVEALERAQLLAQGLWVNGNDVPPSHRAAFAPLVGRGHAPVSATAFLKGLTPAPGPQPSMAFLYFRFKPPDALQGQVRARYEERFGPVPKPAAQELEWVDPYQAWFTINLADLRGEGLLREAAGMGTRSAHQFPTIREWAPHGHLDVGPATGAYEVRVLPASAPYFAAALEWAGAPVDRTFLTWRD